MSAAVPAAVPASVSAAMADVIDLTADLGVKLNAMTSAMWTSVAAVDVQASRLLTGGRGRKRKENDPHQALLRVHGSDEHIYETHGDLMDKLISTAQRAVALYKEDRKREKKESDMWRLVTWGAMRRFPGSIKMEPLSLIDFVDLSDHKMRCVEVRSRAILVGVPLRYDDEEGYKDHDSGQTWAIGYERHASLKWDANMQTWGGQWFHKLVIDKSLRLLQWHVFCLCERRNPTLKAFFNNDGHNDLKKIIFSML